MSEKLHVGEKPVLLNVIVVLSIALLWMMTVQVSPAFADEDAPEASVAASESASKAQEASEASEGAAANPSAEQAKEDALHTVFGGVPLMGNDYVWFGRNLKLGQHVFDNDVIAAGQIVDIEDCAAAGSIRAAAQDIVLDGTSAGENITVAAETVTIRNGEANAIAVAGRTVTVSGSCKELTAYAEKVFIDATVEGDVAVGANTVEVGPNARIKGTLHVSAPGEPVMQRGAEVGNVDFEQAKGSSTEKISSGVAALGGMFAILAIVIGVVSTLLIAVLAEWLFRRHTAAAASMIRARTGATIGTGVVGAFVAPLVVIILFCLVITIPVAAAMTLTLFAITCVATGFAGASLFKLIFPRLGRFQCALAGGAIMGVVSAIPVLGALVGMLAFMYLLGYMLQSIFLGMRDSTLGGPGVMPTSAASVQAAPHAGVASAVSYTPAAPVPSSAPVASGVPYTEIDSAVSTAPNDSPAPPVR